MVNFSKISIKNLFKNVDVLKKNIGLVFWAILAVVIILEIFVIKASVLKVVESHSEPISQVKEKGVRINFEDYNKVINRINAAKDFEVTKPVVNDPF